MKRIDAIPAIRHFSQTGHNFEHDAKFTIIEQIRNLNKEKQEKRRILEHREDLWILKLKTLQPYGLNDKLNHPQEVAGLILQIRHHFFKGNLCLTLAHVYKIIRFTITPLTLQPFVH